MKRFLLLMVLSASCYAAEVDIGELALVITSDGTLSCVVVSTTPLMVSC